jgi:hypothetical protein
MLEFTFLNREIRRLCEQDTAASARFGPEVAAALRKRLADLEAASHPWEPPVGNVRLDGSFADGRVCLVDLDDGWALRFRVGHAEPPLSPEGTVDWHSVSRIQIMDVLRL